MREAAAPPRASAAAPATRRPYVAPSAGRTRQVALTRSPLAGAPLLALWVLLSAVGSGLLLLLLKRPRRARAELADVAALLHPWQMVGARWRARGQRQVRGRDLHALFVPPRAAARATVDMLHDALGSDRPAATGPGAPTDVQLETGPVAEETEELTSLPPTWPARAARHPGLLAVLATLVVAVA